MIATKVNTIQIRNKLLHLRVKYAQQEHIVLFTGWEALHFVLLELQVVQQVLNLLPLVFRAHLELTALKDQALLLVVALERTVSLQNKVLPHLVSSAKLASTVAQRTLDLLALTALTIHQLAKLLHLPVFYALLATTASVQQVLPQPAIQVTTAH